MNLSMIALGAIVAANLFFICFSSFLLERYLNNYTCHERGASSEPPINIYRIDRSLITWDSIENSRLVPRPDNAMWVHLPHYAEGVYTRPRFAVAGGGSIRVYIATVNPRTSVSVYNLKTGQLVLRIDRVPTNHPSRYCDSQEGCDWLPSMRIPIPKSWQSGVYVIKIECQLCQRLNVLRRGSVLGTRQAHFVVGCPNIKLKSNNVLFPLSWMSGGWGYNVYGGRSLYHTTDFQYKMYQFVEGQDPQIQMSLNRPVLQLGIYENLHMSRYTKLTDDPWSWNVKPLLVEFGNECFITTEALGHQDMEYLMQFRLIALLSKQEYFPITTVHTLKEYVLERGGTLYFDAYEFFYTYLQPIDSNGESFVMSNRLYENLTPVEQSMFPLVPHSRKSFMKAKTFPTHYSSWLNVGIAHFIDAEKPNITMNIVNSTHFMASSRQVDTFMFPATTPDWLGNAADNIQFNSTIKRWCFKNSMIDCASTFIWALSDKFREESSSGGLDYVCMRGPFRVWMGHYYVGKGMVYVRGRGQHEIGPLKHFLLNYLS